MPISPTSFGTPLSVSINLMPIHFIYFATLVIITQHHVMFIKPLLLYGLMGLCYSHDTLVGISLKTQELYALVFAARYLDLFVHFVSLYNTVMKLVFLASSFSIVWYMRRHKIVRRTYDKDHDTFHHYILVLPCLLLALLVNERFTFREVSVFIFLSSTLLANAYANTVAIQVCSPITFLDNVLTFGLWLLPCWSHCF